jgi:predicted DNA-binding protein YlxM (UPF0122 family)
MSMPVVRLTLAIDPHNESQAEIAPQLGISRQALTDQIALRKRPNAETLLRMQAMMKKRPRKKGTSARLMAELRQRYPRLFAI